MSSIAAIAQYIQDQFGRHPAANALKHAFPAHRSGKIIVDYHSDKAGWSLTFTIDAVRPDVNSLATRKGVALGSDLTAGEQSVFANVYEGRFTCFRLWCDPRKPKQQEG